MHGHRLLQCVVMPVAEDRFALQQPFATTAYFCGAVTMNSLVAFADGWSIIGNQSRALFG